MSYGPNDLTPVEHHAGIWFKRDDLCEVAGVRGGKARTCWALAQGYTAGLITAGSRQSPQAEIVAHIAHELGLPCRIHTSTGALGPELESAQAVGAEIIQHKPGYNSVIIARALTDRRDRINWRYIPFGMECLEAVTQTARQVDNLPVEVKRIVIPVGSGMSLAGVIEGLAQNHREVPILGVVVGADPKKRLDRYAPAWRSTVRLTEAGVPYEQPATITQIGGIELDPIYEAKCLPMLSVGDLLWCIGKRGSKETS